MLGKFKNETLVALGGTVFILFLSLSLIAFVFYFRRRRNAHLREKDNLKKSFEHALLQSQVEVQEATLSTLATELHDNIGQLLSSTKMLLGITERNVGTLPDSFMVANETLGKAISELRSLSKSLNKEWLEQFNLLENLDAEVDRINAGQTVAVQLTHPPNINLRSDEQIILFRIIQESLQNAIKHAHPNAINIKIESLDSSLTVTIIDNGCGFDAEHNKTGHGFTNMRKRTELLGGTIEWKSEEQAGCTVKIVVPTNAETDSEESVESVLS